MISLRSPWRSAPCFGPSKWCRSSWRGPGEDERGKEVLTLVGLVGLVGLAELAVEWPHVDKVGHMSIPSSGRGPDWFSSAAGTPAIEAN
jgi:hypothetical protein